MLIMLTNDDGILAPGLQSLQAELEKFAEVVVIAPEKEQSAVSHSITVHKPLRVQKIGTRMYAANGTPADCVKLALEDLMDRRPDLIISGINRGANLGTDVLYSGTVSAAMEGVINGIPSLAVSLASDNAEEFTFAAETTAKITRFLYEKGFLNNAIVLNVNIPYIPPHEIKGVAFTSLGLRRYVNPIHRRVDPRGRTYYWLAGEVCEEGSQPGSDVRAIAAGKISITPLQLDLTDYNSLKNMQGWSSLLEKCII
ncbi:MAG: 5'/3'-nucleotidase SurE [Clostridia bacterium]|nr:5'/3'-nucleotidase SurE [Clostridia bacterium]